MPSLRTSTAGGFERPSRRSFPRPNRPPSAVKLDALTPGAGPLARFADDLARLVGPARLGLAVSGGADSMALLLLAAASRRGALTAITVDHGLRPEAAAEAGRVGALCERLGVPHTVLALELEEGRNLQARARAARYAVMAREARVSGLEALVTAHHADDQAETLVMRLARGAGLSGLAGIRPSQTIEGSLVLRPLLGWRKADLEEVCRAADVEWAIDPSNSDPRFDRTAARQALRGLALDPVMVGRSAAHLADAEEALDWAIEQAAERLLVDGRKATLDVEDLPPEIVRRLFLRAFALLGADRPRGPDLERATAQLLSSESTTLSGLALKPLSATLWHLSPAPPRRS